MGDAERATYREGTAAHVYVKLLKLYMREGMQIYIHTYYTYMYVMYVYIDRYLLVGLFVCLFVCAVMAKANKALTSRQNTHSDTHPHIHSCVWLWQIEIFFVFFF